MTANPYWTKDGKAKNLALLTSTERCKMRETLLQTEAAEWKMRFAKKSIEIGTVKARSWWLDIKQDLLKKRGQAGLDTLILEMNRQRHDANTLSSRG
jgi:hypothetical protein